MSSHTPRLIHPIPVTVERLARSQMVMDVDAREPIHGARTSTAQKFTIPAQVKWVMKDNADPQEGGVRERSEGYVLMRLKDMDKIMGEGERLKRGDRITTIGIQKDLDVYIVREEPIAHLQNLGGTTMIKYHFADRHPVKQQGDL